jgi:hypothetical protein
MTEGDCKYGSYNYREKGVQAHVYHAALRRHLAKWWNGEWADPDTAVPHLASVLACAGILIDAVCCHKLNDDRPVRVPSMDDVQRAIQTGTAQLHATYPIRAPRSLENPHQTKKDKLS